MRAIVAVTRDWGIGCEGRLLVRNAADMRRFRELTTGGTVVMGRVTFQGLPGGALPKRRNVVVTANEGFSAEGVEVAHSLEEALTLVAADNPDAVWLIGGGRLYRELLPSCTEAVVTLNDTVERADTFFPDLDADPSWRLSGIEGTGTTKAGIAYEFRRYENLARRP